MDFLVPKGLTHDNTVYLGPARFFEFFTLGFVLKADRLKFWSRRVAQQQLSGV